MTVDATHPPCPEGAPIHWLVQTDQGPEGGVQRLLHAIRARGDGLTLIERHPPFATAPPVVEVPPGTLVLVYGTANLVEQVAAHRPWAPGVFFEPDRFTYTAWAAHYGAHLLNDPADAHQVTLAQLIDQRERLPLLRLEDVFVRPEHDLKAFPGTVRTPTDLLAWAHGAIAGQVPQVGPDTPVVIAPAHGITAEWRVVVTDQGEVIGSSQYRSRGRLKIVPDTPDEVRAFARDRARQWSPAPVFVLDVARSGEGLYVVEAQCAHCAGFYAMDLNGWAEGVARTARRAAPAPSVEPAGHERQNDSRPTSNAPPPIARRRPLR